MRPKNQNKIEGRVTEAAEQALATKHFVSAIDIFTGIGVLSVKQVEDWRRGKIPHLEGAIQGNLSKISQTMKAFRLWGKNRNLKPSETVYLRWGGGSKNPLRFSKSGLETIEKAYRTHFVSPKLSQKQES